MSFDEYDMNKLKQAKKLLNEVYEYNYCSNGMAKRLATIIKKMEILEQLNEQKGGIK